MSCHRLLSALVLCFKIFANGSSLTFAPVAYDSFHRRLDLVEVHIGAFWKLLRECADGASGALLEFAPFTGDFLAVRVVVMEVLVWRKDSW